MTCTIRYQETEAMAEAGWSEDEIAELQASVELAQAKANRTAVDLGLTREQGRRLEQKAIDEALVVAHDRFHRKLADFMASMPKGDAKVMVHHGHDHGSTAMNNAMRESLKKLGFE